MTQIVLKESSCQWILFLGKILGNISKCNLRQKEKFIITIIKINSIAQMKLAIPVINNQL